MTVNPWQGNLGGLRYKASGQKQSTDCMHEQSRVSRKKGKKRIACQHRSGCRGKYTRKPARDRTMSGSSKMKERNEPTKVPAW